MEQTKVICKVITSGGQGRGESAGCEAMDTITGGSGRVPLLNAPAGICLAIKWSHVVTSQARLIS